MKQRQCLVEDLMVADGGRPVLGPLSFSLDMRAATLILGANGAGKSVLLRALHGLVGLSDGRIDWDGKAPRECRQRRGFVFQTPQILRRSIRANIAFGLRARGLPAERGVIDMALEGARLTDFADLPAGRLSGGERQRLAFACARLGKPDILLLDEPSASLDPSSTAALEGMIAEALADGIGIVMATHDLAQARRLGGRALFLADGKLVEEGPIERLLREPASMGARAYLAGRI